MKTGLGIIIAIQGKRVGRMSRREGWLKLDSLAVDSAGQWWIRLECSCTVTQDSWRRCSQHGHLSQLWVQVELPFRQIPG